ncbi:MAG: leucine-rich repeat domain-containing protein [Treponema sp.]|nr:leucine-rich repeat domain-containing protein [Treponema sp.]
MTKIDVDNKLGDISIELVEKDGDFTVTIKRYIGDSEEIIIPDNFGGIPVTVIGNLAFLGNESLINVILPESLVIIEGSAFRDCIGLTEIKLPQSLTTIGSGAFENCEKLSKITIPKNTVDIATSAFDNCNNLKEITVDEQNPYFASRDGVLFDKNFTTLIFYPQAKEGDYTIPDTVNTITPKAFSNKIRGLTSLYFPKDLIDIGSFGNCEKLTRFSVNENSRYFSSIDGVLFEKSKEGKVEGIMCYPQGKKGTNYTVPDYVWWIRFDAFYNCKNLTSIILPEGLEHIGEEAFYGCEGLSELVLPASLEYIAKGAFKECPNLKTITLSRNTKMGHKSLDGFSGELIYRD